MKYAIVNNTPNPIFWWDKANAHPPAPLPVNQMSNGFPYDPADGFINVINNNKRRSVMCKIDLPKAGDWIFKLTGGPCQVTFDTNANSNTYTIINNTDTDIFWWIGPNAFPTQPLGIGKTSQQYSYQPDWNYMSFYANNSNNKEIGTVAFPSHGSITITITNDEVVCQRIEAPWSTNKYPLDGWMEAINDKIGDKPLKNIAIPGSHDAGSSSIVVGSAQTQSISILKQLEAGSRYIDLRAKPGAGNKFWIYHGILPTSLTLDDAMTQIETFAKAHPKEIVIVTLLIEGTGASQEYDKIVAQLNPYLITETTTLADTTINQLYKNGKNIVFASWQASLTFMDRAGVYDGSDETPEKIYQYLETHYNTSLKNKMWIWHLVGVFDLTNSLENQAQINSNYFCFKFEELNKQYDFNIINLDYISLFDWVGPIISLNTDIQG